MNGQILYYYSYLNYLEESDSQKQKVQWQLPEAGGEGRVGSYYLMHTALQFGMMKKFWRWI